MDGSLAIAQSFEARNVKVISQENKGACAARNRALREAQGDYIQFLDADDLMSPRKIETQVMQLEANPRAVAASRWTRFYDQVGDGPHGPVPDYIQSTDPLAWLLLAQRGKAMMPSHGWLAPRDLIDAAGQWEESILKNQDGEFFARVLLEANEIIFCPEVTVYYRSGISTSVSARRSSAALHSQYEMAYKIMRELRAREDSSRVREACADAFQKIAYSAYPNAMDVVTQAEAQVRQLGGSDVRPPGSSFFLRVGELLGWKTALWLRHSFWRIKYSFNRT
jgi:glycosyltransferase involved in cell wall biosynthesis